MMTTSDSDDDIFTRRKRRAPRLPDHLSDGESSALNATSEQNIPQSRNNDPNFDPYDEDARSRGRVAPRMVDITQPIPQAKPSAAVPRPHQPQKKLRPHEIVPDEDQDISIIQKIGMTLLTDRIWPCDPLRNPVLVYFTGKVRGRVFEDFMGLAPWILLGFLDMYLYFQVFLLPENFIAYNIVKIPIVMLASAILTIGMLSAHVRKTMAILPLNEMLLTRLKYHEIAQGISIRPVSIQAFGAGMTTVLQFLVIGATMYRGVYDELTVIVALGIMVIQYQFFMVSIEMGGAMGLRANICIRQGGIAMLKAILDLSLLCIIFIILIIVLSVLSSLLVLISLILGIVSPVIPVAVILTCALVISNIVKNFLTGESSEAIQWTFLYPEEWWVFEDQEAIEGVQRGLWTPWKTQATQRKINLSYAKD